MKQIDHRKRMKTLTVLCVVSYVLMCVLASVILERLPAHVKIELDRPFSAYHIGVILYVSVYSLPLLVKICRFARELKSTGYLIFSYVGIVHHGGFVLLSMIKFINPDLPIEIDVM